MKKKSVRIFSTLTTGALLFSALSYVALKSTVNADSYRTDCTTYGDLNKDDVLDVFDLILLRDKINNKEYDNESDLNNDGSTNKTDLLLLNDYLLGKDTFFTAYLSDDTDEDELCDLAEIRYYNTDPDNSDTDGDNLPDYYEITVTSTDPNDPNSCNAKVNDGDYDSDFDTISNKEEYELKTNPLNEDTDYDDLTDDYEIGTSKTDPVFPDTDDDNVYDGDEIKLNLDPNAASTDGTTNDSKIITHQEIDSNSEALSSINTDNSNFSLSLEIDAAGYAENSIKVHTSKYRELLKNNSLVGDPIEITYNPNLIVNSININFNLAENQNRTISNYMIFRFFPENNYLLPVETQCEDGVVSTTSDEPGIFCVIDINEYKKILDETGIFQKNSDGSISNKKHEILFILDLSKSIDGKVEETKNSIRDFCDLIFNTTEGSTVSFAAYYENKTATFPSQNICRNSAEVEKILNYIGPLTESKDSNILAAMSSAQILSSPASDIFTESCENKHIFIISDSDYNHNNSKNGYSILTETPNFKNFFSSVKENNVELSFILAKENYKNRYTDYLINLCDNYEFNVYSRSMLDSFIYCMYNDTWGVDSTHRFYMFGNQPYPTNDDKISINKNEFIAGLPAGFDISKIPSSDTNGNILIKDALKSISKTDENGNIIGPKLFDECDKSRATALGICQMKNFLTPEELLLYYGIPLTNVVINPTYATQESEGMDFQYAFTKGDKNFYSPKTYYPDLYTTNGHMEKINGEYDSNGNWIDWR